ncbi:MAG: LCP family protein [Anaerolineaceae bacterium]|nr:LCP family protein [Anaerolineaceae bacterium]
MRSQRTQTNRISRTNARTTSRPNPTQKVDPRRHRRQPPKPLEVVAVVILLSLICVLGFILISGFIASLNPSSVAASSGPTQNPIAALPTATPFQPGEGGEQANLPSEGEQPGEVLPSPTPTEDILEKPEGQINILLLGSDIRPNDGGFRTDVIMWVSLNPADEYVSIISFPRDLFVSIPGWGSNRINTAFQYGGFELLADTFEVNFGIRPDYYVMVDFNGFKTVINDLGGIDVNAAYNLSDTCATWINASGYCSVGPGWVHMNGEVALWYARSRYSTSDIDRARRAQEVGEAIFNRMVSLDALVRAPELYNAYVNYVQTDIGLSEVVSLLPFASKINDNRDIRNYVVNYNYAYDWTTTAGAQVLVPDYYAIESLLIEALSLR